jgi:iron(III) transport system ATP-binding protein
LLAIENVSKHFGDRNTTEAALCEVSLDVRKGELVVLLGPSGSGKTTLLRCVAGLLEPTAGKISLSGKVVADPSRRLHVPPNKRQLGMVFQNFALWAHMTVRQNVEYPLRAQHKKDLIKSGRVDRILDLVQCSHLAKRLPATLSGGQQQRVSLARALVAQPALLLFDEPLSNLDAMLRLELRRQLREIHRRTGFTGIYVTHDQQEALGLADRIAMMEAGRLVQVGRPEELYESPATEFVAEFMGMSNHFTARREGTHWLNPVADLSALDRKDLGGVAEARVRFRPSRVRLQHRQSAMRHATDAVLLREMTVLDSALTGEYVEYTLVFTGGEFKARISHDSPQFPVGSVVDGHLHVRDVAIFPCAAPTQSRLR